MISPDCNDLHLDQQLCFKLFTASRLVMKTYQPLLNELSISYPQYLVMLVLWELQDKDALPVKLCALEKELRLDSATLTPLLKQMKEGALISSKRCPADERDMDIDLASLGLQLKPMADEWRQARIDDDSLPFALMARLHHDISDLIDWMEQSH